ncbi:amidase [Bacillus sp. NTK071]|uniref:amidase family protein n=1 Tax=Bacillus sp. NTK071 TaxID=2802175 RepID=UPI001A8D0FDD|nr:amidase family protein [Bacillus sp. NTK071]MBN8209140.1 amidase [Bacillus sp. NTK071]
MLAIEWLEQSTIIDLQHAMFKGELTSHQLVRFYLEQIAKHNSHINAVLEVNPDALFIAEGLDRERKQMGSRGLLHGIPILLKDNINTGDNMHTSAGSSALSNSFGKEDAFLVKKLREAGAVILGKTNMTEWANFMSDSMPNGYSSRGGQVLNPYGPGTLDVGGSSSGSAAAVACHFATAAIGTETNGSILSPASSNAVVGIKPTIGTVSRKGIIPISLSQDIAGPITRNVTDAAIILGVISGVDVADPSTFHVPSYHDYTPYLLQTLLEEFRIGIVKKGYYNDMHPEEQEQMNRAVDKLKKAGCSIVEIEEISARQEDLENDYQVLLHEFKSGINNYLAKETNSTNMTLESIIAFNNANKDTALRYGHPLLVEANQTSGQLSDSDYLKSRLFDLKYAKEEGLDHIMETERLDVLLFTGCYGSTLPAKAGYPSITVPAGSTSNNKPFGITFTGKGFSETQLINLAYVYEQQTNYRKLPNL